MDREVDGVGGRVSATGPLRVAHIVGAMNRAGVETWLMNVARRTSPEEVELTFVEHSSSPSDYDEEIRALGHRIAICSDPHNPLRYALNLRRLLRGKGTHFDAVHSHVGNFSALPLAVAWISGVRVRIAHSHSDSRTAEKSAGALRRVYFSITRAVIRATSTVALASSEEACLSLYRRSPQAGSSFQVLPTGIDIEAFAAASTELRTELGIDSTTVIVGHIGRFVPVKNHRLLVSMAKEFDVIGSDVHLVLVGDGPLRAQVERDMNDAGAAERVSFLGTRSDIPNLLGAFDVLVLPSHYEGVPITLLEAQASGCPCLVSSRVSKAGDVVPGLITRLDIEDAPSQWAAECVRLGSERRGGARELRASAIMRSSDYNIEVTLERLHQLWLTGR